MSPSPTTLTAPAATGSRYQLDLAQVQKASTALLAHIKSVSKERALLSGKQDLFAPTATTSLTSSSVVDDDVDDSPVWLVLTTKKHVTDKTRLKPTKISLRYPLNTSPTLSICLITNDPQRAFKDLIASPEFPSTQLRGQITRVIAISKLRARYKAFESVRQLFSSHDVFLADDRVVTMLPKLLGKVFFKSTAKRPIPVRISGRKAGEIKAKTAEAANVKIDARPVTAVELAKELQKALDSALVNLSPSTNTSVRVGKAGWTPEMIKENVTTVVEGLVTKIVPAGWRGVRALHLKGGSTAALPIWLADELWSGEGDVLEVLHGADDNVPALGASAAAGPKLISAAGRAGTKRKRTNQGATKETTIPVASNTDGPIAEDVQPSSKKARQEEDKSEVTKEEKKKIKERLAKQKESAKQTVDGDLALSITAVAKKLRARKKRDASAAEGEEKPSKKAKKQKSAEIETEQRSKSNKSKKSKPIDDDNEEGEKQTQKQKEKERKTHDS